MTIIPAQSISGTNPDKAFLILKNISNCIIGQSVTGCNMNRLYINNCICIPFQTNKEEQQKKYTIFHIIRFNIRIIPFLIRKSLLTNKQNKFLRCHSFDLHFYFELSPHTPCLYYYLGTTQISG